MTQQAVCPAQLPWTRGRSKFRVGVCLWEFEREILTRQHLKTKRSPGAGDLSPKHTSFVCPGRPQHPIGKDVEQQATGTCRVSLPSQSHGNKVESEAVGVNPAPLDERLPRAERGAGTSWCDLATEARPYF